MMRQTGSDNVRGEKMERLTFRQKLRWFADYYLFKVILITAGAVLAFILLKLVMFPGSVPEAQILVISKVRGDYSAVENLLSEKMGYPESDHAVHIEYMEEKTAFSGTVLGMKLSSGEFDAVISEKEHFHFFEDSGLLADLEKVSGEKIPDLPEDRLIRCEGGQADTEYSDTGEEVIPGAVLPDSYISGISLEGNELYSVCTEYMEDPVLGIIQSTDDMEEEKVILECAY